ncbi:MAG: sigma factor-like helix-turn-helix DNA-binding protein, partial [Actinomycetota bacterium]
MTLEEELGGLLRAVGLGSRQREAVARRLGWDGGAPATLAVAAETVGYTRERVRQLEERVEKAVPAMQPSLPLTKAAVGVVGEVAPASRDEAAAALAERGISERPFDPEGILSAARLAGIAVDVVARPRAVLRGTDVVLEPVVAQVAKSLVSRDGAATADAVAKTTGMSRRRVRRLLELGHEVTWLDCGGGWFTVLPV